MKKLLNLFLIFFKIGAFTLGGGYVMLPIIHREIVEKHRWIDEEEFLNMLTIAQSSPGPLAVNTSIYTGYRLAGSAGVFFCTLGTILPSFIILVFVAAFYSEFQQILWVQKFFQGVRPAVVALIIHAAWKLGKAASLTQLGMITCALAIALVLFGVNPIYLIGAGPFVGLIAGNKLVRKKEGK